MQREVTSLKKRSCRDSSGGPVVKTPCLQSRGHGFDPWLGKLRFHVLCDTTSGGGESACGDTGPHLCWLSLPGRGPPGSPGEEKLGSQSQGKGGMWSVAGHGGENHALPGVSFPGLPAWPQTPGGMRISKPRLLHGAGGQDVGLDGCPGGVSSGQSLHRLLLWAVTVVVKILATRVFVPFSRGSSQPRD